ncbi:Rho guanine nucleotide exchange factor [Parasponia andersonii]|uniref:Rho guanine nucleotide exchange factor n=1 Tax=Parasponia andersonii TaxID=3476 RepID=A0A2P5AXL9_PARAD|nr:Rho guanine nucleotide exchange factor [Parasponia andersonii]
MASIVVTQEEFNRFHTIDRELYTLLVINLFRDPAESMQVMGMWLWLEQKGFHNVVKKMLSLPHFLINELADEAVICLTFLTSATETPFASYDINDIPLIQCLMEKEITFKFFNDNRPNAAQEVAKIVNDVCVRALSDIMQQAIILENNCSQNHAMVLPTASFHSNIGRFGLYYGSSSGGTPDLNEVSVPPDDRTMFVTFSKGYPVFEWEVREFFTRTYGDCIESLYMQEVQPNEQSLFARIVFHSASAIDVILDGLSKAKFTINGKHVWMRKFIPKRTKSQLLQPLPNLPVSLYD